MIIVLLLFFRSICLYCQRLILQIHDRWINPKNTRLLKEAAETTKTANQRKLLQQNSERSRHKRPKKRYTTIPSDSGSASTSYLADETCRFCLNSVQGYCRHHFHLQELQLQRQRQQHQQQQNIQHRFWNPLSNVLADKTQEYRQLRKINRELKRNLKNRLNTQNHRQQQKQQQQFKNLHHQTLQKRQQQEEEYNQFYTYQPIPSTPQRFPETSCPTYEFRKDRNFTCSHLDDYEYTIVPNHKTIYNINTVDFEDPTKEKSLTTEHYNKTNTATHNNEVNYIFEPILAPSSPKSIQSSDSSTSSTSSI
ncbi:putative cyclin-dependent serine/threonine-protein kinase DDB_G0272797/DDB_G0274007 [Teleopsis dalmanni]|uniref:putative cyclin-dependent serine/threonine-protein kinase DDB_G0272797/DDB_G0274007 n=1 Tax=Teleopsis dalmanni TaxID=139649 RepID=UPI0018CE51AC|nr:putative cyclin-dependent serine/threonine-protein kinase DDB_G0272797/DDB_G0274007 [Teleopsis dalmanni]